MARGLEEENDPSSRRPTSSVDSLPQRMLSFPHQARCTPPARQARQTTPQRNRLVLRPQASNRRVLPLALLLCRKGAVGQERGDTYRHVPRDDSTKHLILPDQIQVGSH